VIIIPDHGKQVIVRLLLWKIIRDMGLTVEEYNRLLDSLQLFLDHNYQGITHVDCVCGLDAPFAEDGLPDSQIGLLARRDEGIASMTVLRLLGHEAGLVIGGGFGHGGGSFHLAMVSSAVWS
jgi:hypothetical protein